MTARQPVPETARQRRAQAQAFARWEAARQRHAAEAERRYLAATRHAARAARELHDITRSVGRPCPHCLEEADR